MKRDHRHLSWKLDIRRWALAAASLGELRVLDLCAGEGQVWKQLRTEYRVASYTPCDIKPRMPGTMTMDISQARYLDVFDLSRVNVIDIDVYGRQAWQAWLHLAPKIRQKTAVFLTNGLTSATGRASLSAPMRSLLGIPDDWNIPASPKLTEYAASACLRKTCDYCQVLKAGKIYSHYVSYYAMVVEPSTANLSSAPAA